mgnify:CR=1 FL=1
MDAFVGAVNTLLLIILFFYQRNKNKTLKDRLDSQSALLEDTKALVVQQSAAIKSQRDVVESALAYSEKFDPDKLENIIRREVSQENSQEVAELRRQFAAELANVELRESEKTKEIFERLADVSTEIAAEKIAPLLRYVLLSLINMDIDQRRKAIEKFPSDLRAMIEKALTDIDRQLEEIKHGET